MIRTAARSAASPALTAAALIVIAMAMMGLVDNYVVTIAETTGLWQFQVIRSGMALCLLTAVARWQGWRLMPRRWGPVIARSAVLSSGLMIYFAALAVMPISEAVAGLFTAPIFVLILSGLAFGHRIGPVRIGAVVLGFFGVLMVLRPDAGAITWLAILPILSGMFYALAALATREWCAGEAAVTLLYGFFAAMGLWGLLGLAVLGVAPQVAPAGAAGFAMRFWGEMSAEAWAWTVAQAVFSLLAVGLIIRAYQIGEASFVAVYEYGLLLSVVMWGYVLFGTRIDLWAMVGIAAIVTSGAVIALRSGSDAR
ncbi:DMT family transporter [Pseudoruegeria sp. SK021]|uniref:DMT family transporter n=1 Tax=Pseudoruegeria sp. SK021 TaxID=1933035 RepID=UPI000A2451C9|nr:DMT family transporter [Pseudoruegeria sp. SK021]OSP56323.1 hypothetical protein BV911_03290 [Pseudoruegeria sp. SK021]